MNHLEDPALAAGEVLSPARVLRAFALSDAVSELIAPRLDELVRAIPRLRPWRGFNEGAWVIGARTAADKQRATRADYSRVEFEIRVDAEVHGVALACRRTLRGRDLHTEHLDLVLDASGRERLAAWLETVLLGFAESYHERPS